MKGKSILQHPDRSTIDRMLQTGWSPQKVHDWLFSRKKELVTAQTIASYRKNHIDAKLILDPSIYALKLKQLDVQIDSLQELYNLIEVQKRRLGYLIKVEDQSEIALPDTRDEIKVLRDTIIKTVELEMQLGIRSKAAFEVIEKRIDITELLREFIAQKELMAVIDP